MKSLYLVWALRLAVYDFIEELDIDGYCNQFITLNGIEILDTPMRLSQLYTNF